MGKLLPTALSLAVLMSLLPAALWAKEISTVPKYVKIPVYYLTDRHADENGYGNHRRYQTNCLHHMYYGTVWVNVENSLHEQQGAKFDSLGWKGTADYGEDGPQIEEVDPSQWQLAKRLFFDRIKTALDRAAADKLCVFVQGGAEDFRDAASDAAQLAYHLHRPLVLYSWPATPKLVDYAVDSGNAEWSQGHFNLFCRDLTRLREIRPFKLVLIAHSIGNRFVFRGLPSLYRFDLVADCELVSPDIDIDTCRHYMLGFRRMDSNAGIIRLYVSNKDKMLKLSQRVFGGYPRLGEDVHSEPVPGRAVQQLTVHKMAQKDKDRDNDKGWDQAVASHRYDVNEEQSEDASDIELLERIDFTAVDKGFTGHSIPFELIAAMVNGNQPGKDLELVEDKTDMDKRPLKVVRTVKPASEAGKP